MTTSPNLCLPKTAIELLTKVSDVNRHPGLKLDKLSWAEDQQEQIKAINAVCACTGDNELLKTLLERRIAALDAFGVWRFHGQTTGSLTLHLARANALENAGVALHPIYGFAWLPGTGLKGMTRAWAETAWKPGEPDQQAAEDRINEAFGTQGAAGRVIFHDAWPVRWPKLACDIVNSHHSEYYDEGTEKKPPGDWENPKPVYFLIVASKTEFEFALSDRLHARDGLLEQVVGWMCAALEYAGVGAKTAAGYGRIEPLLPDLLDRHIPDLPDDYLRREHRLTLASPAFLAGAKQDQADCDLRPASLRGLLRWWWRTTHAKHLSSRDLAQLEALIWGDTQRGSAVSLSLRAGSRNAEAERYEKNKIKQDLSLPKPKDSKTVQGLFYASYGMDERNSKERWYRHPDDSWDITLTSRETCWPTNPEKNQAEIKIPATLVMRQAEAALWLLARFGGVGSKSRKGFGSFGDVSVEGIDSIEDCCAVGRELRECCSIESQDGYGTGTSALETRIGPVEIETPWKAKDYWFALDRVGQVYQRFVKTLEKSDREMLGLPRGNNNDRLASPVHWSLNAGDDKCLTIRLIAFAGYKSTDKEATLGILKDLSEFAESELDREVSQHKRDARPPLKRPHSMEPKHQLKSGQEIDAELLVEKTKNGGWKAKEISTGIIGNIENNPSVPDDAKSGQKVTLIVKIPNPKNASFQWPTPEIIEKLKRLATRNRQRRRRRK
ncbi:type III-B CRISPR module RAMP protein Cmr6 [Ruegeria sp.]|uniref:type III-B CRISPR module RAMP protein Cmr6 n=1 Tax=Ruegeria sp. TaxID=1879320 RepID=UPI003C7AA522